MYMDYDALAADLTAAYEPAGMHPAAVDAYWTAIGEGAAPDEALNDAAALDYAHDRAARFADTEDDQQDEDDDVRGNDFGLAL